MPICTKAVPTSSPEAEKCVGIDTLYKTKSPFAGGIASNTEGGTVKTPALTGAAQAKSTVWFAGAAVVEDPRITTNEPDEPPLHVTVTPCARLMVETAFMFVHTRGEGIEFDALLKGPMTADPEPLKVNVPPPVGINPAGRAVL